MVKKTKLKSKRLNKIPVKKKGIKKAPRSNANSRKRVPTMIKGFDPLVGGGFLPGFTILVIGTPGTGKTLFTLEYAYHGAKDFNEKCMYITFEQSLEDLRMQAAGIGLNLAPLEKSGNLTLMHIPVNELDAHTIDSIKKIVKKRGIQRLVVDSLSTLSVNAPIYSPIQDIALRDIMSYKSFFSPPILGNFVVKRFLYGFLTDLKAMKCTTLVTTEAPENGEFMTRDTVSEFLADGILLLNFEALGGAYSRSLLVRKMRGTKNNEDIHPMEISSKGIVVHGISDTKQEWN